MIWVQNVLHGGDIHRNEENKQDVHSDFYFCMMTYGKCVYWMDQTKIVLEKGDVLFIPKEYSFYWKSIPTVVHAKYVVTFKLIKDVPILPILTSKQYIHTKLGCYELILDRMKSLHSGWVDKGSYYDIYSSALLMEIFTHLNREVDRGPIISEKHRYIELMKKYIQDHYRNKITKDDLAEVIHKTPNHTATLFRTITGQTISEYVHMLRTKTAIYMLRDSQLNVSEISEFLGYSDVSYFNKTFKRVTGKSPSYYLSERPSRIT